MRIEELLVDPRRREHAAMPEADALTETDALQEAELLDVRLDPLRSTVWLLFDCRGALQIRMGNTAVIVAREVQDVSVLCHKLDLERASGSQRGPPRGQ